MAEGCGTALGKGGTDIRGWEEGHGAIVLRASAYDPMRVAETLEEGVLIIVWCTALEFGIGSLRCPEVHPVRLKHGGYHLSVLLTALAKASCSMHGAGCRTYPGVDMMEQWFGLVAAEQSR
jgi:hypothetical protein